MIRSFAIAALITAAPAAAQTQVPTPAAEALTAAADLVSALDIKGQMRASMTAQMIDVRSGAALSRALEQNPAFRMARAQNPQKFDEVLQRVGAMQAAATEKVMVEMEPVAIQAAIMSYARHFTAKELRDLAKFYRTPLGQSLRDKQPAVLADSAALTQNQVMPRIAAAMETIVPQVNAELQTLAPPAQPSQP
ncbi:MAG: DUF2059 domain-containing protein [Alphaproteobacteria bacterium]|nr:DUF2059 domain-containing protein [Alphaproteobacteria bacterium]